MSNLTIRSEEIKEKVNLDSYRNCESPRGNVVE